MKRQLLGSINTTQFLRNFPKIVLVVFLFMSIGLLSTAQADSAMLRVGHFVFDGLPINLYIDGDAVAGEDGVPYPLDPMTLPYQYLELSADTHSFGLTADGEEDRITEAEFTLEAEHSYLLAILGNANADDQHFSLIDETAGLEAFDMSISAVTIHINNMYDVSLDASLGDVPVYSNLEYGDYVFAQDPTDVSGSKIFLSDDPNSVIFELAEAVASPPQTLAVFVFSGVYPGTIWEDYGDFYGVQFFGELSIHDAGTIAIGDSVDVSFDGMGHRNQYTLSLEEEATLDIMLASTNSVEGADAYLRVYDEAGNLILDNDELSVEDNADGIFDAGVSGLELEAGTYIIEAASFVDSGVGEFILSVSEAE
jgi:hypothetical protein